MKLRPGRKVGRTLYLMQGEEPSDEDTLVGLVDNPKLAEKICAKVNDSGPWIDADEIERTICIETLEQTFETLRGLTDAIWGRDPQWAAKNIHATRAIKVVGEVRDILKESS